MYRIKLGLTPSGLASCHAIVWIRIKFYSLYARNKGFYISFYYILVGVYKLAQSVRQGQGPEIRVLSPGRALVFPLSHQQELSCVIVPINES